ncbi:hypothetical protein HK098_004988 [Nowakowskiella sp. JEL0407]|nr:hypothetical protein HK098_004988 [Nowakowskiella sp. JEL0407]
MLDLLSVLPCVPTGLTIGKESEVMGETISTTDNHTQTNGTEGSGANLFTANVDLKARDNADISDPVGQYGVDDVTDSVGVGAFENENFGVLGAGMAASVRVVEEAIALTPNVNRAVTDENTLKLDVEDGGFDDGIDNNQDNINVLADETDAAGEVVNTESTETNTVEGSFYLFPSKTLWVVLEHLGVRLPSINSIRTFAKKSLPLLTLHHIAENGEDEGFTYLSPVEIIAQEIFQVGLLKSLHVYPDETPNIWLHYLCGSKWRTSKQF